jgi:predicted transcriptional regulator
MIPTSLSKRDPRTIIKRLMLKDPSMTVSEIADVLQRKGHRLTTLAIGSVRSEFRHSLHVIEEDGLLKIPIDWNPKKRPALPDRDRNVGDFEPGSENWTDRPRWQRSPRKPVGMSRGRKKIIQAIVGAGRSISPTALVNATGMRSANVRSLLRRMVKDGDVEKAGLGRYRLPRTYDP